MMHALDAEACTVLSAHMHYMMIWLLKSASKPKQPVITVFSIKEVKSRFFSSISPLISCAFFPSLFSHSPTNQTLWLSLFLFWPPLILLPLYLFFPCYLSSVPCSLSLFLPPFLFSFLSLSRPSISPFPPPSLPRVSLSPSQHVIKSNLSGSVKAKQES